MIPWPVPLKIRSFPSERKSVIYYNLKSWSGDVVFVLTNWCGFPSKRCGKVNWCCMMWQYPAEPIGACSVAKKLLTTPNLNIYSSEFVALIVQEASLPHPIALRHTIKGIKILFHKPNRLQCIVEIVKIMSE